jgi:lipoyl(octanoyl) transferase
MSSSARNLVVHDLGLVEYEDGLALQRAFALARKHRSVSDALLLLEHPPVLTLGRAARVDHVVAPREKLEKAGVMLFPTDRGGDVTYHGPGQIVGYPIVDLSPDRCDVRRYVRALAEVMILVAREHHVEAGVVEGMIGIWVDQASPGEWAGEPYARKLAKLGAIGVRISRWITMHGFALNLTTDLEAFRLIVPCGITAHGVTTIEALTGRKPLVRDVALAAAAPLRAALDLAVDEVVDLSHVRSVEDLDAALLP